MSGQVVLCFACLSINDICIMPAKLLRSILIGLIVGGLLLALVVAVVKLVLGVLVIALFENSMARLRFCATSRVTWAGFGFAFLAFVSLLVA